MDGRISIWLLTLPLTALCAGCLTQTTQKTDNVVRPDEAAKVIKKGDGPKRDPKPATEIKFGEMKENEADSAAGKTHPEIQAQLRDEARKAYQHALKLDPDNVDAQRHLAKLYAKMGDYWRAQDIYKKAMAKRPNDATLWYDLGMCHSRRKELPDNQRFPEAIRCFTKALELEPENRDYLKMLGFTLAWTGRIDQGLVYLTRAYGSAQAHLEMACMFDQKRESTLAIQQLRLALQENPQLQTARDFLTALENPGAAPNRVIPASRTGG